MLVFENRKVPISRNSLHSCLFFSFKELYFRRDRLERLVICMHVRRVRWDEIVNANTRFNQFNPRNNTLRLISMINTRCHVRVNILFFSFWNFFARLFSFTLYGSFSSFFFLKKLIHSVYIYITCSKTMFIKKKTKSWMKKKEEAIATVTPKVAYRISNLTTESRRLEGVI